MINQKLACFLVCDNYYCGYLDFGLYQNVRPKNARRCTHRTKAMLPTNEKHRGSAALRCGFPLLRGDNRLAGMATKVLAGGEASEAAYPPQSPSHRRGRVGWVLRWRIE